MRHIIVDIDGTISKVGDRLKYIQQDKPDWDSFYEACFEDEPVVNIIRIVEHFFILNKSIVFCTGRRESVRGATTEWINKHLPFLRGEYQLLMRPNGDLRHDTEVKPEQLSNAGIMLQEIYFVLEDRNSMVEKWRSLGLTCLQVAEGDF